MCSSCLWFRSLWHSLFLQEWQASLPATVGAYLSLAYILEIAKFFAALPFASFAVPAFPFVYVLVAYGVLIAFLLYLTYKKEASPLRRWTIVEESVFKASLVKQELPVFFK
jgi:hypothetical protein